MTTAPLTLRVEYETGLQGEPIPRRFYLGDKTVRVEAVLDRWLASDYCYVKVRSEEQDIFILRHDVPEQRWELTLFRSGRYDANLKFTPSSAQLQTYSLLAFNGSATQETLRQPPQSHR